MAEGQSRINTMWIVGVVIVIVIAYNWNNSSSCAAGKRKGGNVRAREQMLVPSLEYQQRTRPTPRSELIDRTANASRMFTVAASFRDTHKTPVGSELRI